MGIEINNRTEADLFGYEMKNQTTSGKTTFGDWSADYYIFKNSKYFYSEDNRINRDQFMEIFGTYKPDKRRCSWSGEVTKVSASKYVANNTDE